jgi:hypothetical protein
MGGIYPKSPKTRGERIEIFEKLLKEDPDHEDIVIAKFCLSENVSLRKAREYLKLLRLAGRLETT